MISDRGGYSLIELVAALTIFGLGVIGSMELSASCLRSTSLSLGYTQAVFLAQGLMEETIAEDTYYTGTEDGDFGEAYPRHSWELEIEDTDTSDLMQLTVTVSWDERGQQRSYVLTTLVAERWLPE